MDINEEHNIVFDVGMISDIGARKSQQDAAIVSNDPNNQRVLAVLCDGMGGMTGGEKASNLAADMIYNNYCDTQEAEGIENYQEFLINELINADKAVAGIKDEDGSYIRAGSTVVAVAIDKDYMFWAGAGDSRLYIIRDNEIMQMTKDHNYLMELMEEVQCGRITLEEALSHPEREALVSFLGMDGLKYIDTNKNAFRLLPNDVLIVCSDGLYRVLSKENIKEIMIACEEDMQSAASYLVEQAISLGGRSQDNTTVIAMKYIN